jgi:hypothetical protein
MVPLPVPLKVGTTASLKGAFGVSVGETPINIKTTNDRNRCIASPRKVSMCPNEASNKDQKARYPEIVEVQHNEKGCVFFVQQMEADA